MAKIVLTAADLKELALSEMRRHKGCEEIADVSILPFSDPRIESNWRVDLTAYGGAERNAANRAALYVQHNLRQRYLLETDA